jgi:hypothetical protein
VRRPARHFDRATAEKLDEMPAKAGGVLTA